MKFIESYSLKIVLTRILLCTITNIFFLLQSNDISLFIDNYTNKSNEISYVWNDSLAKFTSEIVPSYLFGLEKTYFNLESACKQFRVEEKKVCD